MNTHTLLHIQFQHFSNCCYFLGLREKQLHSSSLKGALSFLWHSGPQDISLIGYVRQAFGGLVSPVQIPRVEMPVVRWQPLSMVVRSLSMMSCNTGCEYLGESFLCLLSISMESFFHHVMCSTSSQVLFRGNWFMCMCIFVVSMEWVWSRNLSLLISPNWIFYLL